MTTQPEPNASGVSARFNFSNLSGRTPGTFFRLARRWLPGVDYVADEIAPYAAAWLKHNIAALDQTGPLWVVIGDSLSLGIGASSIDKSWVLQAARMLSDGGLTYRIVNLSISGARVTDVLERELPAMHKLGVTPDLVTVLIGSNDVVTHDLRAALPARFAALLDALPRGALVAVADRPHGVLAEVDRLVRSAARTGAVHVVPARLATRDRAEDHFHLNDHGYALVAEDFASVIVASAQHVQPTPKEST